MLLTFNEAITFWLWRLTKATPKIFQITTFNEAITFWLWRLTLIPSVKALFVLLQRSHNLLVMETCITWYTGCTIALSFNEAITFWLWRPWDSTHNFLQAPSFNEAITFWLWRPLNYKETFEIFTNLQRSHNLLVMETIGTNSLPCEIQVVLQRSHNLLVMETIVMRYWFVVEVFLQRSHNLLVMETAWNPFILHSFERLYLSLILSYVLSIHYTLLYYKVWLKIICSSARMLKGAGRTSRIKSSHIIHKMAANWWIGNDHLL